MKKIIAGIAVIAGATVIVKKTYDWWYGFKKPSMDVDGYLKSLIARARYRTSPESIKTFQEQYWFDGEGDTRSEEMKSRYAETTDELGNSTRIWNVTINNESTREAPCSVDSNDNFFDDCEEDTTCLDKLVETCGCEEIVDLSDYN